MKKIYEDKSIESIKRKSERLLTNSEREFLLECYKNQKHYKLLILVIYLIELVPFLAVSIFFYKFSGVISGVICFLLLNSIFLIFIMNSNLSRKNQIKQIKINKLYVTEAVYDCSNTNGIGFFTLTHNNELYNERAVLCEPDIKSGDRVILVKKKSQVWVYKARN